MCWKTDNNERFLDFARNDRNTRFFSANLKGFHGCRVDPRDSWNARDEIWRGLGAGRNLQLQAASLGPPIFHAQRCPGTDRLRDFSQYDGAIAHAARRRCAGAGLWTDFGFRSSRTIPTQRANFANAGAWFASGQVRSAQA